MAGYTVTFPDVAGASTALSGAAEELRSELRQLSAAVDALLGHGWRGRAASSFAADWELWRCAASDVIDVLVTLAARLGRGEDAYATTEAAVRQAAS